jgi:DNA-directed RNA polymerase specialized sigma subunit
MDNAEKKAYLRRYLEAEKKVRRLKDEIEAEHAAYMSIKGLAYDDMPHASGGRITDISDMLVKIEKLVNQLGREVDQQYAIRKEIRKRIEAVDTENERSVLYYRYIRGCTWEWIAERMHLDVRWIHRIHGKALAHFSI